MLESLKALLPDSPGGTRVGILGGSFDPPHLGHQLLGLGALATAGIDELWVMPCASHAFQKPLTAFEHRLTMCQLAFSYLKNTHVVAIENSLPAPNYTIQTIQTILGLRPDLSLSFIMGSDVMEHFDQWASSEQVKKLAKLVVFDRVSLLPGVQSTQIREAVQRCDFKNIDLRVQAYIRTHRLYVS